MSAASVRVAGVRASDLVRCASRRCCRRMMLAIPFCTLVVFILNILLMRDRRQPTSSGTGAAIGTVTQIGPIVTVLVVAGAGATAMCADLGARTIREELDAMRVHGHQPDPSAGRAPGAGRHPRGAACCHAVVTMVGLDRRVLLFGLRPARHAGRLRRGLDRCSSGCPTSSSRWSRPRCSAWPPA